MRRKLVRGETIARYSWGFAPPDLDFFAYYVIADATDRGGGGVQLQVQRGSAVVFVPIPRDLYDKLPEADILEDAGDLV